MGNKNILLLGGAGYIGSHVYLELIKDLYNPIIVDNLSNSSVQVINKLEKITSKEVIFHQYDMQDGKEIKKLIDSYNIESTVLLAAKKSVEESIKYPIEYFRNNVSELINFLECIKDTNCKNLIFSSSACVYGNAKKSPILETHPTSSTNPYGLTKIISEKILNSFVEIHNNFKLCILRYFNPAGYHTSGLIGENNNGEIKNLFPNIESVIMSKKNKFSLYGTDYNTKDGTCIRDFVHIEDLSNGHLAAINYLQNNNQNIIVNLGSGRGYSILEILENYQRIAKQKINIEHCERRSGDIAAIFADISRARDLLKWKPRKNLDDMIVSSLNYAQTINE